MVIAIALSLIPAYGASAARVRASLDSTVMLMGTLNNLKLQVEQKQSEKGRFPIFDMVHERGFTALCGDSVELRAPSKIDTVEKNGNLSITFNIPVQAFDSGYYKLPEIAFVIGRDTSYSNPVALKVVPVLAEATDPINDYANVSDPEGMSVFDHIPDWLYNYWWVIWLIIALLAALVYLYLRYRKTGSILKKKPLPTPYEQAVAALKELKAENLWQQGEEKEYYTRLTDILRTYLYGRFGLNALEMTSRQILARLKTIEETKPFRQDFKQILGMADFVKFAKVRPLAEDCILSMDNAMAFVESTKPVELTQEDATTTDSAKVKGKGQGKNGKNKVKGGAK